MPRFGAEFALLLALIVLCDAVVRIPVTQKRTKYKKGPDTRTVLINSDNKGDGGDYTVPLKIGDKYMSLTIDTGSALTAVGACGYQLPIDTCYDSSSYGQDLQQPGSNTYVTGGWSGAWYRDRVTFDGVDESNNNKDYTATAEFISITQHSDFFWATAAGSPSPVNGIIGLAYAALTQYSYKTVIDSVIAENQLPDVFSLYLCPAVSGQNGYLGFLNIGAGESLTGLYDTQRGVSWTPIKQQTFYTVEIEGLYIDNTRITSADAALASTDPYSNNCNIVDSGYSSIGVLPDVYNGIVDYLRNHGFGPDSLFTGGHSSYLLGANRDNWPTISFKLENDVWLNVPPRAYLQKLNTQCDEYQFMFSNAGNGNGNALGNPIFNEYFIIFDRSRGRVGFAPIAGLDSFCDSPATPSGTSGCSYTAHGADPLVRPKSSDGNSAIIAVAVVVPLLVAAALVAIVVVVRRRRQARDVELTAAADRADVDHDVA